MMTAAQLVPPAVCRLLAACPHIEGITMLLTQRHGKVEAPATLSIGDGPEPATLDIGYLTRCAVPRMEADTRLGMRSSSPRGSVLALVERVERELRSAAAETMKEARRAKRLDRRAALEKNAAEHEKAADDMGALYGEVFAAWSRLPSEDAPDAAPST